LVSLYFYPIYLHYFGMRGSSYVYYRKNVFECNECVNVFVCDNVYLLSTLSYRLFCFG
jgi:hypothetical protein